MISQHLEHLVNNKQQIVEISLINSSAAYLVLQISNRVHVVYDQVLKQLVHKPQIF